MKPELIKMVCGSTGAGKIATSLNAVVFSIDDWMMSLFGPLCAGLASEAAPD